MKPMQLIRLNKVENLETKKIDALIYGKWMTGKTTLAAGFPNPIILSTDGNFTHLRKKFPDIAAMIIPDTYKEQKMGVEIDECGWVFFKQMVELLTSENCPDEYKFDTIIIDLAKDVFELCRQYVFKQLKITHESEDKRQGRVWNLMDSEFGKVLRKLKQSDKNIIYISHEKIDQSKNNEKDIVPDLKASVNGIIQRYSTLCGRLTVKTSLSGKETRFLETKSSRSQVGGNRLDIDSDIEDPTYDKIIEAIKQAMKINSSIEQGE